MSTTNRTLLVSGGAGFIGSHFVRMMNSEHNTIRIVVFDKLTYAGNLDNIKAIIDNKNCIFVKGDIADQKALAKVFRKYRPDYVVNFAAESHVDRSIHNGAEEFVRTNVFGVFSLLESVRKNSFVKKFVQVSTDEVYGDVEVTSKVRFSEDSPLRPSSPYASTKASGDLLCLSYARTYEVPVVITRGSNTYGPNQFPEKIIPFFVSRMIQEKNLPVYGDGKNTRDWLYVTDHCRAIEECLLKGKPGEIYNVSADEYHSNADIALRIAKYFGKNKDAIEFVKDRPGHDRKYAPDSKKIRKAIGWRAKYRFANAFADTLQWYADNREWMEQLLKKSKSINSHII